MKGCWLGLHDLPVPLHGLGLGEAVGRLGGVCMNCDGVFEVQGGRFGARWRRIAAPPWAMEGWRESGAEPGWDKGADPRMGRRRERAAAR